MNHRYNAPRVRITDGSEKTVPSKRKHGVYDAENRVGNRWREWKKKEDVTKKEGKREGKIHMMHDYVEYMYRSYMAV